MRTRSNHSQTAHLAPNYRRVTGPRKPRAPQGPLVDCAGCGKGKRKPLEARFAGTMHPVFTPAKRVERGQPVCVYCYVQLETFGRTRLDGDIELDGGAA